MAITPICYRTFNPWSDLVFLQALRTFVQARCCSNRCLHNGLGRCMQWASSLGILEENLAVCRLRPLLQGKHVFVHMDNTEMVAYINRQGGVRSLRMSQLLLWSQQRLRRLRSLHTIQIYCELNRAADGLS